MEMSTSHNAIVTVINTCTFRQLFGYITENIDTHVRHITNATYQITDNSDRQRQLLNVKRHYIIPTGRQHKT